MLEAAKAEERWSRSQIPEMNGIADGLVFLRRPVTVLCLFTFTVPGFSASAARCAECGLPAAVASWRLAPAVGCGVSFADRLG